MLKNKDLIIFSSFFLLCFYFAYIPISTYDVWWHLKAGEIIWEKKEILRKDIFSFTSEGKEWIDHSWLSQVLLYLFQKNFGINGVILLQFILVFLISSVLYLRISKMMPKSFAFLCTVLIIFMIKKGFNHRPHLFSLLMLSLLLYFIESKKYRYIPVILALWSNLHGGFIVGIIVSSIYLFQKNNRILLASLLSPLINPYTYKIYLYTFQYAKNSVHTRFISEWQSPSFHEPTILEAMILFSFLAFPKVNMREKILVLLFTHLVLFAVRNELFYAIIVVPLIFKGLLEYNPRILSIEREKKPIYIGIVIGLSFILIPFLGYLNVSKPDYSVIHNNYPYGAVNFLKQKDFGKNLFTTYRWGGFCIYHLYPKYKVFIDGRADVHQNLLETYSKIYRLNVEPISVLKKYNVSVLLIEKNSPLDIYLKSRMNSSYRDGISVVYILEENN